MSKFTIFVVLAAAAVARAEAPKLAEQQFKNIQVLKGMPAGQLGPVMDVMAAALGVGCQHCHVKGPPEGPWPMDKDDKEAKRTARKMVTMMQRINRDFFGDNQVVTCATCHNGHVEPRSVPPFGVVEREGGGDEEAKPPALTVKQIVDKWVQASGGQAAWQKLRTRTTSGSFVGGGPQPLPVEIVQAAPERWHAKLTGPQGLIEQAWDGKQGWRRFGTRVLPLNADDLADVRRDASLAPPLAWPKLFTGLKVVADAPLGKGSAHVLKGKQGELGVRLWFDAQTGLLARVTVRQPTPVGDLAQQIDYEDYRVVDGVKLPFLVKQQKGGETSTETYSEIKHNAPVDEAQFAAPKETPPAPQGK